MQNQENEPTPESIEVSNEQLEKMWADAKVSMSAHSWIQRGTEVTCESCPFRHSFYLEPGHILKGIDNDGKPIIDNITY
jgi:hypothetical protein